MPSLPVSVSTPPATTSALATGLPEKASVTLPVRARGVGVGDGGIGVAVGGTGVAVGPYGVGVLSPSHAQSAHTTANRKSVTNRLRVVFRATRSSGYPRFAFRASVLRVKTTSLYIIFGVGPYLMPARSSGTCHC